MYTHNFFFGFTLENWTDVGNTNSNRIIVVWNTINSGGLRGSNFKFYF